MTDSEPHLTEHRRTAAPAGAEDQARALRLVHGYMASQALGAAVRLNIADALAESPKSCADLAAATDTDPDALRRLLRALETLGLVERPSRTDLFTLTSFGDVLRSDADAPAHALANLFTSPAVWRPWGELHQSVRTGATAFETVFGMPAFAYIGRQAELSALFNAAMAETAQGAADVVAAGCDFSRFPTVVDVGGGNGTLLAALLTAHPGSRGVLLDTPTGVREAPKVLADAGVADRCTITTGDFFTAVPAGGDAYVLKSVIHDWDDEPARTVLRRCREAMPDHAKLLLVEPVLPGENGPAAELSVVLSDLNMLVMAGGRERTEAEYATLLDSAGLELVGVGGPLAPTHFQILEAVPR
ncbi:O-demethylpuromycin-O-methyltransferase [Streptomyces davaonensis JCM 4913]|uniref:O-demethylpuromycin-O-methyltransferase n=1 Tax=Streptomyces davaonensis (strain DSM 101723 / JCM 4913 / KCC S-0913 / 768) TaxID=1214101 RepID=K4QX52_STRDJ|nr:methyltransferase [Streptomyces davaonensis]CCK25400.1 O-demethylpuromycin-O-methyltransferase [Streptomyces davaonensis JCM 4913]